MDRDRIPALPEPQCNAVTPPPPPKEVAQRCRKRPLDSCAICLEPITERAIAVPCNHCAFDFLCLVSWIQARSSCPLCKANLTAVQYDWRAPHDFKTYTIPKDSDQTSLPAPHAARRPQERHRPPPRQRRRPLPAPRPIPGLTHDATIRRRKYVYEHRLYSAHVGANRISQYREVTPAVFAKSADLQSRARHWIRRELHVFDFLSPDYDAGAGARASEHGTPAAHALRRQQNAEFLLEYIVSILKTVDIRAASGRAQEMLGELLGAADAALFLHELLAWLRSPYLRLEDWDRHVQYTRPLPPTC